MAKPRLISLSERQTVFGIVGKVEHGLRSQLTCDYS